MSRSVDLLESENVTNIDDSVVENNNNNDESITEDAALDNATFDPFVDYTHDPRPENN